jgi:hypothetical protein
VSLVSREDRIAKNEALFREVNERIEEIQEPAAETFGVVCECGDADCKEMLEITTEEYEEVRAKPTYFLVLPGHEILEVETVIESRTHFNVVEKLAGEEELARVTHPRQPLNE